MHKILLFAVLVVLSLVACQKKDGNQQEATQVNALAQTEQTTPDETVETKQVETKKVEPQGLIYRSDGFYNGIASEWLQMYFDTETGKLQNIWYWNTQDEKKIELKIVGQELGSGEISAMTVYLQFPNETTKKTLTMVEGNVTLTHEDDRSQDFDYEGREDK
jgi:hypothetical protein